jgi:hypothetical protein
MSVRVWFRYGKESAARCGLVRCGWCIDVDQTTDPIRRSRLLRPCSFSGLRSGLATSIAGGTVAAAFAMWWRRSPIRRRSWLLLVASLAWALAAVGNLLGDVFDMPIGETLWTAEGIAFGLTLVAGAVALTVDSRWRWSGLFLIGYAAGFGLPDSGGLWLSGVSLIAMALWIDRTAAQTDESDIPNGLDAIA